MATTIGSTNFSWSRRSSLYWALAAVAVIALIAFLTMGRDSTSGRDGYSAPAASTSNSIPGSGTSGAGNRR